MLFGSVVLIVWTHKSRSPKTPMLWYCPVAFLMTTWAQYENALWGFQIAWYMVLICLMGAMAVLNRRHVGPLSLAIAAGIAVIGSYSSLQGLLIWPAGLVLLAYHRRSWRLLTAWVVAAMATTGLYMYHLDSSPLSYYRIDPLAHPVFAAKLFFFSLGNVAGKPLPIASLTVPTHGHPLLGTASPWIVVFGVLIFASGIIAIAKTGFSGRRQGSEPLGVALIVFAFAFDGLTAIGRGLYGYSAVSASRYTTYDLLALVGAYLVVVSQPSRGSRRAMSEDVRGICRRVCPSRWSKGRCNIGASPSRAGDGVRRDSGGVRLLQRTFGRPGQAPRRLGRVRSHPPLSRSSWGSRQRSFSCDLSEHSRGRAPDSTGGTRPTRHVRLALRSAVRAASSRRGSSDWSETGARGGGNPGQSGNSLRTLLLAVPITSNKFLHGQTPFGRFHRCRPARQPASRRAEVVASPVRGVVCYISCSAETSVQVGRLQPASLLRASQAPSSFGVRGGRI